MMDSKKMQSNVLALTDESVVRFSSVMHIARELTKEAVELSDLLVITQASSLSHLPLESSSMDTVIFVCTLPEFSGNMLFMEILRVLKPGGIILVHKTSKVMNGQTYQTSTLENKILIAGFVEPQVIQLKAIVPSDDIQYTGIKANKPSWKIGSSFSIKKATKALPKVQIDVDMDLIDEDSLLTEEDLKKPQLLPADDCEVGSTRKACKNCSCGRAEAEAKVEKLGLTDDQLENPQSACGSCGLGDAFRCGTCPYKGLPAFKLGEKVSLSQNFLLADI